MCSAAAVVVCCCSDLLLFRSQHRMLRKWPVAAAALVVLAVSTWAVVHYGRTTGFSQLFDLPVLNSPSTGPPMRPVVISRPSVIPEPDADARALWLASAGSTAINGSQLLFTLPPSGRGTFVINAPVLGRPAPVRSGHGVVRDYWLVSVINAPTISVPPVTLRTSGRLDYVFELCLPPAQPLPFNDSSFPRTLPTKFVTYHLRLFLVMGGVNTSSSLHDSVTGVHASFAKSPVTFEADVRVPLAQIIEGLAPSTWPLANGFDASLSPRRRRCSVRDLNTLGEGWVTTNTARSGQLPWLTNHQAWQSSSCNFPQPSGESLRRGLMGRWLAFVGDSSMQEQTKLAMYSLGIEQNTSMEYELGNCHQYRMVDTGLGYPGMEGMRLSHFWAGGPKVCDAWIGVLTWLDEDFIAKLSTRLTFGGTPDFLIFNSGLHDRSRPLTHYAKGIETAFTTLRRIVGPKCVLVWKSTLASTIEGLAEFEEFNAIALGLLQRFAADGPVATIDQFALTLPKFIFGAGSANPNHCSDASPVDVGCASMASAISVLLNDGPGSGDAVEAA